MGSSMLIELFFLFFSFLILGSQYRRGGGWARLGSQALCLDGWAK